MVIGDLDLAGIAVIPFKADSPLIVDSNAILVFPVAAHPFEPVAWDRCQCRKVGSRVQHV